MTTFDPTTEKILTAIEDKRVKPRPKRYFILRNSVLWIPGLITTLLGGYTIAGIIYGILHNPLIHLAPNVQRPVAITIAVPILWVVSFGIFLAVTLSLVRKMHIAYRRSALQLLLISVASSIVIGALFYALTQDSLDNQLNTYYRYPTQYQKNYFERNISPQRIN
jgi:hypothetical protein